MTNGLDEYIARCSCKGNHFLTVSVDDDDGEMWLSICGDYRPPHGIWTRLNLARKVIARGHGDSWVEVLLDKGQAAAFGKVLADWAAAHKEEEKEDGTERQ